MNFGFLAKRFKRYKKIEFILYNNKKQGMNSSFSFIVNVGGRGHRHLMNRNFATEMKLFFTKHSINQ